MLATSVAASAAPTLAAAAVVAAAEPSTLPTDPIPTAALTSGIAALPSPRHTAYVPRSPWCHLGDAGRAHR